MTKPKDLNVILAASLPNFTFSEICRFSSNEKHGFTSKKTLD